MHGKVGTQALPKICDQFPRKYLQENDTHVFVGETTCPVVAREVLTEDDAFLFSPYSGNVPKGRSKKWFSPSEAVCIGGPFPPFEVSK